MSPHWGCRSGRLAPEKNASNRQSDRLFPRVRAGKGQAGRNRQRIFALPALSGPPSSPINAPTTGAQLLALAPSGEVAEWLNAPHSKCGIGASLSGVRIPPSPPSSLDDAVSGLHLASFAESIGVLDDGFPSQILWYPRIAIARQNRAGILQSSLWQWLCEPYQGFESFSLRQPTRIVSYRELQIGQKLGPFPVFCRRRTLSVSEIQDQQWLPRPLRKSHDVRVSSGVRFL